MLRKFLNLTLGFVLATPIAHAETPVWFFEHFTDGSLHDDAPISWHTAGYGESLSIVDGDLLLTPQPELAAAIADEANYQDVSLLTRLRVSTPGFSDAGLIARKDGGVAYTAGITGNRMGRYDHSLILTYGGLKKSNFEILASAPTNLDPSKTDVLLQFDIVDDSMSLFAWADGTPRPAQPQLAVRDGRIQQGAIGTFFDSDSSNATAGFRELLAMPGQNGAANLMRFERQTLSSYVEADQAAIPEPSCGAMALAGLVVALLRRSICRNKGRLRS
jgi:hypothetical protein